ncbi:MAG: hypothetical protein AAF304_09250 [Pseudomonadota bacterium]
MRKSYVIVIIVIMAVQFTNFTSVLASESQRGHHSYYGNGYGASGSAESMVADVVIARPIGLVTTVVGSAVYVVSLPFSLLGGNEKQAREKLVNEPAVFTFKRPLGEFPSLD